MFCLCILFFLFRLNCLFFYLTSSYLALLSPALPAVILAEAIPNWIRLKGSGSFTLHSQNTLSTHCTIIMCQSVQSLSRVWLFATPWTAAHQGLPVHHQLPESSQTHVRWVTDAIQPSHPLPSPSPPTFNLSQHQGLFKQVSSSHQVARVLEFQLQYWSFQWTPRTDLL